MPPGTTIKKFVEALQTKKTIINSRLDELCTDSRRHEACLANLNKPGALNRPLAGWAKEELRTVGLGEVEFAHIDRWPDEHKEEVRKALVTAVETSRNVRFFWELYGGADNVTDVRDGGTGDITVTFRSPQSRIRVSRTTFGDLKVEV